MIDGISLDMYKLDDSEADRVFEYLRRVVYPRLHPHQNVWVVPGLFGSVANNSVDEMLVRKLDRYWAMAINDSRVVGVRHGRLHICAHACRPPERRGSMCRSSRGTSTTTRR